MRSPDSGEQRGRQGAGGTGPESRDRPPNRGRRPIRAIILLVAIGAGIVFAAWSVSPAHGAASALGLILLDRLLLFAESRGWINYRRVGLSRGGATYHLLETTSVFVPRMDEIIDVKYADEKEHDEEGGPET